MTISLSGVTKSFDNKVVLSNFSYDFPDTGVVAVTGPSGVGKTTLLRIISGLEKKFSGELIKSDSVKISVAFQEHRLFQNLTALENLTSIVFERANAEDIEAASALLLELGFSESELRLYPSEMSGGMKQRVSLARAFLRRSDVLLLDEPTKELDGELVKEVLDIIKRLSRERLVIIVTHRPSDIEYLDAEILNLNGETKTPPTV